MLFVGTVGAQTLRPGVLVVGNSNAATAAAIQSAVSGVKTILLLQASGFDIVPIVGGYSSGLEAQFLEKFNEANKTKNSQSDDKKIANDVFIKLTDSLKNLTIIKNAVWVKASRSGSNWVFNLNDGRTIRPKVLINPSDQKLNQTLKITIPIKSWIALDYSNSNYRTSIASGKSVGQSTANYFSLYNFIDEKQENFIPVIDDKSMLLGQAAGATAAYAAFFSKKTSESNLKTIQGELINYKLNLLPFADIKHTDTNWKAIQFVGLTGVLKANISKELVNFNPNQLVSTDEVKQPIKDYFYKAQIYFDDYKSDKMTIGATIDLVCYVGNKAPESTKKEIDKKWKTNYQFKSELDYTRQINRIEFAVLLQDYLPPFNVNIDKGGSVVR